MKGVGHRGTGEREGEAQGREGRGGERGVGRGAQGRRRGSERELDTRKRRGSEMGRWGGGGW